MGRWRTLTRSLLIEFTGYDRPALLASVTTMTGTSISGTLTFDPVSAGTLMRWSWVVRTKGPLRLMEPVIAWVGRRQEREIWANLKRHLEAEPPPSADAQPQDSGPAGSAG